MTLPTCLPEQGPTVGSVGCSCLSLTPACRQLITTPSISDSSEFSFNRQYGYLGKLNLGFLSQYFRCGLRTP